MREFDPVKSWLYVITGYLQTRGTRTRLVGLWKRLHDCYASPSTVVALCPWSTDWDAEAEFVYRLSCKFGRPSVRVFAYSWGAGWGFTRFACALGRRSIHVTDAVLSDPVYRHGYRLGNWRALVRWPRIAIPPTVRRAEYFTQDAGWLRGHKLRAVGPNTILEGPREVVRSTHGAMDERPEFLNRCLEVAADVVAEPGGQIR